MRGRECGHQEVPSRLRFRRAFFSTIALFVFCQMASAKTLHEGRMHSHHTLDISGKGKPTDTLVTIPKLLHYIYLPGLQAYKTESNKPESRIPSKHFEGCQKIHTHWDSLFWDEVMGLQLVKEFYPWFLPVWEGYDGWGKQAKKSDALRVFIMHHYGGLYLDLDVECYKAVDESLKDYQLVLQGTGDEGVNNCVMASVPGHPFWTEYAKTLVTRSALGSTPQFQSPMYMSGTLALTRSLMDFIPNPGLRPVSGYNGVEYQANGTVRVYAIGEWFIPCYGSDHICNKQYEKETKEGIWDMTNLYGRHYFSESSMPAQIALQLQPHTVAVL